MRRNPKYSQFDDDKVKKIIYLTGAILAIGILIFTIAYMIYGTGSNSEINTEEISQLNTATNNSQTEQASNPIGKSVYEMQNNTIQENTANTTTNTVNNTSNTVNNTVKEKKVDEEKNTKNTTKQASVNKKETEEKELIEEANPDPTFIKPCEGNIIREFAKENFVYSDTLKEWVPHYGIDIQADSTSVVKAVEAGTVQSIKNDPRYGLTVIITHSNGFSSIYSNLATAEFVVEGENIEEGQTIGTIGNTATFEILDESHLHFEMMKDGEFVNPEIYCK